ncbi:hypothetical protein IWQ62_002261 [Dispira parvispora]|uniref:MHD domain-containing protein n=1 Tax=Dispira parvispora TaxID=1520584 RepID=A0A9W8AW17_9FUNG|nr:hypothetical protein IWQ62_002261 [Dispira parvispora]
MGLAVASQFIKLLTEQPINTIRPIVELSHRYIGVYIHRSDIVFLCLVASEVSPFLVLEFLEKFYQVILEYFGKVNELVLKENYLTVTKLLEEMLDYGYPLTTNTSMLKEIVPVPNLVSRVMQTVTGSAGLQDSNLNVGTSMIPWRRAGIQHTHNEIYLDIVEEVDFTCEATGQVTSMDITGKILCNCLLSGLPDLTLSFVNPDILDDYSFHPCVRIRKFEQDKVLSFIPPDGQFKLATYRTKAPQSYQPPLVMYARTDVQDGIHHLTLEVDAGETFGKPLRDVVLTLALGESTANLIGKADHGDISIDTRTKVVTWKHKSVKEHTKGLTLRVSYTSNKQQSVGITAGFTVETFAISGLRIHGLRLSNERYQFYKVKWPVWFSLEDDINLKL